MVLSSVSEIGDAAERPVTTVTQVFHLGKTFWIHAVTGFWATFDVPQIFHLFTKRS